MKALGIILFSMSSFGASMAFSGEVVSGKSGGSFSDSVPTHPKAAYIQMRDPETLRIFGICDKDNAYRDHKPKYDTCQEWYAASKQTNQNRAKSRCGGDKALSQDPTKFEVCVFKTAFELDTKSAADQAACGDFHAAISDDKKFKKCMRAPPKIAPVEKVAAADTEVGGETEQTFNAPKLELGNIESPPKAAYKQVDKEGMRLHRLCDVDDAYSNNPAKYKACREKNDIRKSGSER